MEFDVIEEVWKEQGTTDHVKVEKEALLKLVRRNHQTMESTLFRRDFTEVGICLLLVPVWLWMGISMDLPWSWYLVIPGLLWIAGFMLRDRREQRRNAPRPGDSLRESVERSLAQVKHQISLLKNILWWYLLPVGIPLMFFVIHSGISSREHWGIASGLIFHGLVFWGIYELNQWTVRKNLEPRCGELEDFLESLDRSETDSE